MDKLTYWIHGVNAVNKVSFPHVDSNLKGEQIHWKSDTDDPEDLKAAESVAIVKSKLKTFLFSLDLFYLYVLACLAYYYLVYPFILVYFPFYSL